MSDSSLLRAGTEIGFLSIILVPLMGMAKPPNQAVGIVTPRISVPCPLSSVYPFHVFSVGKGSWKPSQ